MKSILYKKLAENYNRIRFAKEHFVLLFFRMHRIVYGISSVQLNVINNLCEKFIIRIDAFYIFAYLLDDIRVVSCGFNEIVDTKKEKQNA